MTAREQILALAGKLVPELSPSMRELLVKMGEESIASYKAELLKEVGESVALVVKDSEGEQLMYPAAIFKYKMASENDIISYLYTSDQVATAILKATGPLEEEVERLKSLAIDLTRERDEQFVSLHELRAQLAAAQADNQELQRQNNRLRSDISDLETQYATQGAKLAATEQRVAEACSELCDEQNAPAFEYSSEAVPGHFLANEIRAGEWRKFLKEE